MNNNNEVRLLDRVLNNIECDTGDCSVVKFNDNLYLFNGILYTNDFYEVPKLLKESKSSFDNETTLKIIKNSEHSFLIEEGSAVAILDSVSFFDKYQDFLTGNDFQELFNDNNIDMNIHNGLWWVRQPKNIAIDLKNIKHIEIYSK